MSVFATLPAEAAIRFDTVALSGSAGTNLGFGPNLGAGIDFSGFLNPVLNSSGEVAFRGTVAGSGISTANDLGIWTNVGGVSTAIAQEGVASLGPNLAADVVFSDFTSVPVLNDAGKVAFTANLSKSGVSAGNGIWTNSPGSLLRAVGSGTSAPGMQTASTFNRILTEIQMNNLGELAFAATVYPNSNGNGADGIWTTVGGALSAVVTTASNLSGGPSGGFTFGITSRPQGINDNGQIAFDGNGTGIWLWKQGAITTIVPANGSWGPTLNAAGNVVFQGNGIYVYRNNVNTLVAGFGANGPGPNLGPGVYFGHTLSSPPILNAAGDAAFLLSFQGTGSDGINGAGIWATHGQALSLVARTGSEQGGPNLGPGIYFDLYMPAGFSMNAHGEIAFWTTIKGTGINSSNDAGIWAWSHGELKAIVREGDLFDVNPDPLISDLRTVKYVNPTGGNTFRGTGGEDGNPRVLNDNGLIVFGLSFTDGTSGIFTAQLPREAGDFDGNGIVDSADLVAWQTHFPSASGATLATGDADGDGDVDGADFVIWQTHFGGGQAADANTVPEPSGGMLIVAAMTSVILCCGRHTVLRFLRYR